MEDIDSVQVDPAAGRNDTGNFLFINLATCETKFRIPPSERRRVNREKLRAVLLKGVAEHVKWSKRLISVETTDEGVTAVFEDGTRASGSLVVGCEGSNSAVRKFLSPEDYRNRQLPIRFVGTGLDMTPAQVKPLRALDPLLFQGCHPETGCFLWVSMLEVPEVNGTAGTDHERYRVQINLSWRVEGEDDEIKSDTREQIRDMKKRASVFAPVLRSAVEAISDDAELVEIKLADWPCLGWDNHDGRVTLVGDAAHAMTMYRGEAANHGMLDAYYLWQALSRMQVAKQPQKEAIRKFEQEMRQRTSPAVQLSRQACFDAHEWDSLNENSPVLAKRAVSMR